MTSRMLVCVAGAAILLACGGCTTREPEEPETVAPVQVTLARRAAVRRLITAEGILYPRDQASLTPKIAAPVSKFYVNRGDHVRAGQLLAVLENRDLAAAAEESKAQYEQARASYREVTGASAPEEMTRAETDLRTARQSLDAAEKLFNSREQLFREGALAQRQVEEARVALAQARAQYENAQKHLDSLKQVSMQEKVKGAEAQVKAAEEHYRSAAAQLSYSQINSPISGVVTDRPLYAGEMASPSAPMITVMDISRIVARLNLPADAVGDLLVGSQATLKFPGGSFNAPGQVTVVSSAVDPNSTTIQVWVEAMNSGERLRPGTSVQVSIVAGTIPDATLVPAAALLPDAGGATSVIVVDGQSVAHRRAVRIGVRESDLVQIVSGVSPGERVVTEGGLGLEDGAKVRITGQEAGRND